MYAIISTGFLKWKYYASSAISSSPAIASDGTIYFGTSGGNFASMTPDGILKLSYYTGYEFRSSPTIPSDSAIYIGCSDSYIYSFALSGTRYKWRYYTGGLIVASPTIGRDGTIYIGSTSNYFYALTSSGTLKWSYYTYGPIYSSANAISTNGTIYVGSNDFYLYAFTSTGGLKWKYLTGGYIKSSPTVGVDGTIYFGSYDYYFYALTSTGSLKWKYYTGNTIDSSAVIGSDATLYFGSNSGYLYALTSLGNLKWRYLTGGAVYSTPLYKNGTIYVGSTDYKLYALLDDTSVPTSSPTSPTLRPTSSPTSPTLLPSTLPTLRPTSSPTSPTLRPSISPTSTPTYSRCPSGTFSNSSTHFKCISCPSGYYSNTFGGAASCTKCNAGYYSGVRSSSCTICQPGSYSTGGASKCTNCTIGTYSTTLGATSSSTCKTCDSGSYSLKKGATSCITCTAGYYATNSTTACQACRSGYFSASNGASICTICAAGSYANKVIASTGCLSCNKGQYSTIAGASSCTNCSVGTYASSTGSTICQSCYPGSYADQTGSTYCTSCPAGTASYAYKATTCNACAGGYYSSSVGYQTCSACTIGTYSSSLIGSTSCTSCRAGTSSNVYGAADISTCTNCSLGTYASSRGWSTCDSCYLGYYADQTGSITCKRCPAGTASYAYKATTCNACAGGYYTSSTGEYSCSICPRGTYSSSLIGSTGCTYCRRGTFSNVYGATNISTCLNCSVGTYSSTLGAVSKSTCLSCSSGTYSNQVGSSACTLCPAGTASSAYKANSSTTCKACARGSYNSYAGSSTCNNCSAGSYSPLLIGSTSCNYCINGTYSDHDGSTICTKCPQGTYSTTVGATSKAYCSVCPSGSYSVKTGSSTCSTCNAGYYTPDSFTACQKCPGGYYSLEPAPSACIACAAGTYSNARTSSTYCIDCKVGYYSSTIAASSIDSCQKCPHSRITANTGAASSDECLSPDINFATGIIALIVAFIFSIVYIVYDRMTYVAVFRQQFLVRKVTETSMLIANYMKEITASSEEGRSIPKPGCGNHVKFLVFMVVCACFIVGSMIATIFFLYVQVFFIAAIIWRDFRFKYTIPFFDRIVEAISFIDIRLVPLFSPLLFVFHYLASIKLDLASVSITCQGSQASPLLFLNILILIVFSFLIESDTSLLITTAFANANQRLRSFLKSDKAKVLIEYSWVKCPLFRGISLVLSNPVLPNPTIPLLQYLIGFVTISSFVSENGRHASTSVCDKVTTAPFIDTTVAILTTILCVLILPAAFYNISRLLIPTFPHNNSILPEDVKVVPGDGFTHTKRLSYIQDAINANKYPKRKQVTMMVWFEPVWVFLALCNRWFDYLLSSTNKENLNIFEPHHGIDHVAHNIPIPYLFPPLILSLTKEAESEWDKAFHDRLPTYSMLVSLVSQEFQTKKVSFPIAYCMSYLLIPQLFTKVGSSCWYFVLYNYITFPCTCFGVWDDLLVSHFELLHKIRQFVTDVEMNEEVMGKIASQQADKESEADGIKIGYTSMDDKQVIFDSESRLEVSSLVGAVVSTRSILCMLVPFCSVLTTFATSISEYPIFLERSETLRLLLPPLFILNAKEIARSRLQKERNLNSNSEWIIYFSSWSIFVNESRFIQFSVQITKYLMSISTVFYPSRFIIVIGFFILALYSFLSSLSKIATVANSMGIEYKGDYITMNDKQKSCLYWINSGNISFCIARFIFSLRYIVLSICGIFFTGLSRCVC